MKIRKFIIAIILIAFQFSSFAQKKVLLNIPTSGKSIKDFIPIDYDTLQTSNCDLNKDGLNDLVLVIANKNEDKFDVKGEPGRMLLVLLSKKAGYRLAGKSTEVVMCRYCGGLYGDPFAGISIDKGVLEIHHYGGSAWRWSENRKFRFQNNGFYLIGSTSDYYWNISDCNGNGVGDAGRRYRDVNWATGDEEVIERDENCKLNKQAKHKFKRKPLVKLESFKYEE